MSIYGIGSDIVACSRIAETYQRFGQRFIKKILTPKECALLPDKPELLIAHLAKRFAAKEALSKALGTGLGQHFHFHDCQIFNDASGKPYIEISDRVKILHPSLSSSHLSLSDEKDYVLAFCVLEKTNP